MEEICKKNTRIRPESIKCYVEQCCISQMCIVSMRTKDPFEGLGIGKYGEPTSHLGVFTGVCFTPLI